MSIWNAIILGLVQGITEFLPVSSSAHLSVLNNLFDMTAAQGQHAFFSVLLHLATIISIGIVYWQDIREMFFEVLALFGAGPLGGQHYERYPAARMFFMIIIATLPLLLVTPVRAMLETLKDNSIFVGVMVILTGCMLFVSDKMNSGKKTGGGMTILDSVLIGLCQCVSAVPGISRCGTTMTAGVAVGLKRDFAVRFSLLLSLPAVLITEIISIVDAARAGVDFHSMPAYLIGMAVAIVAGIGAISLLRYIAKRGRFSGIAYYCWVMGVLSIILTLIF